MIFKAVGLPPRGRLSDFGARTLWRLLGYRRKRLARLIGRPPASDAGRKAQAVPRKVSGTPAATGASIFASPALAEGAGGLPRHKECKEQHRASLDTGHASC